MAAAGIAFFIGLVVYSSYSAQASSCTTSETSSYAMIYDTPECNTAFDATKLARTMMIFGAAAAIGLSAKKFLGR